MELPVAFVGRVARDFGPEEGAALCAALDSVPPVSIRLNPAKCGDAGVLSQRLGAVGQVPWCADGWYLGARPQFTFDPAFHAGAYYVQEAASQFVGWLSGALAGRRVLDLCAAPGGKTTLYASLAGPEGLVVANEIDRRRASVLADNVRKWGTGNVAVTACEPKALGELENWFDVVAVDAPCSGEGMFRKDPASRGEWSESGVRVCAARQDAILREAWRALKPGGRLIYSTCTFNRD
ncbi:MAG: RsmB/NOP family class I SAM-dependent RNA methyltransferase, partial [Alistipes sp.]|nr:RsmB/NOP family class I SAM-dependent RNA methyltransferase [Alistipes sp.]